VAVIELYSIHSDTKIHQVYCSSRQKNERQADSITQQDLHGELYRTVMVMMVILW